MASTPRVRIVFRNTGRGLLRDATVIAAILDEADIPCEILPVPPQDYIGYKWQQYYARGRKLLPAGATRLLDRLHVAASGYRRSPVALTMHLEAISVPSLGRSRINWLVPNQEWFNRFNGRFLSYFDTIICKTQHAKSVFSARHPHCVYTGFASMFHPVEDNPAPSQKEYDWFLHVAGRGLAKGTVGLLEAWRANPAWPPLVVVSDNRFGFDDEYPNIQFRHHATDAELHALRQRAGVTMAPSEVEGFGHVILEAMLYGSCTVTTDAPPMNELVAADRGYLVGWENQSRQRLGVRHSVTARQVEPVVERLLQTPADELAAKAEAARDWAQTHQQAFRERLVSLVREALETA